MEWRKQRKINKNLLYRVEQLRWCLLFVNTTGTKESTIIITMEKRFTFSVAVLMTSADYSRWTMWWAGDHRFSFLHPFRGCVDHTVWRVYLHHYLYESMSFVMKEYFFLFFFNKKNMTNHFVVFHVVLSCQGCLYTRNLVRNGWSIVSLQFVLLPVFNIQSTCNHSNEKSWLFWGWRRWWWWWWWESNTSKCTSFCLSGMKPRCGWNTRSTASEGDKEAKGCVG